MPKTLHVQETPLICKVETKGKKLTVILGKHSVTKKIAESVLEVCNGIENFSEAVRQRIEEILTMNGFEPASFSKITINGQIEKEIKECQGKVEYEPYKRWAKERGLQPIDIKSFIQGSQGESFVKRFRWIRRYRMNIGSQIRFDNNKKIHKIIGFTSDCQLIFDKVKEPKSPIKYNMVMSVVI